MSVIAVVKEVERESSFVNQREQEEAQQQAKQVAEKAYRAALSGGDDAAAIEALKQLGRTLGDCRDWSEILASDRELLRTYKSRLAAVRDRLASSVAARAAILARDEVQEFWREQQQRARSGRTLAASIGNDLARGRLLGLPVDLDISKLQTSDREQVNAAKNKILKQFDFLPLGDGVLPVKRAKS